MSTERPELPRPALGDLAGVLAAAPHRMMFLGGATAVLVSMAWWALVLAGWRWGWAMPQPAAPVPAGWAHAVMLTFGMLPMFFFGFLLTVFPRWLDRPALTRRAYVPVFAGCFGGYLVAHAGLLGVHALFVGGLLLMLAGHAIAFGVLLHVLLASGRRDMHAWSASLALAIGLAGQVLFIAFTLGAPATLGPIAIELGVIGLLLPVYFSVSHRMIPFFSANAVPGYRVVRPAWSLPLMWLLLTLHMACTLAGALRWRWLADLPLFAFFTWHVFSWQPWKARRPGLLAVLHIALLWLPVAFALYAWQSLAMHAGLDGVPARVPVHVLTIGYFGSMLVAMVTRVTQGHSGRPLQMGIVAWISFIAMQGVVLLRIGAEFSHDPGAWLAIAAAAWIAAFLPWVLRSGMIWLTPRIDGKPG